MRRVAMFPWILLASLLSSAACGGSSSAPDASLPTGDSAVAERRDVGFSSDVNLTGYLSTSAASPPGSPGVLLIHQYQRNDEQWGDWPEVLAAQGYRVLAFNLRGHGDSDPYDGSLINILSDPEAAPADVSAALGYLADEGQADPERLAVVGTSIGANLTVGEAINDSARTYVSLSARQSAVENLAGEDAAGMRSVFYLASEGDGGGVQAADAQAMHDLTAEPRKIQVYSGGDHGIALLDNQSDVRGLIEGWLAETL